MTQPVKSTKVGSPAPLHNAACGCVYLWDYNPSAVELETGGTLGLAGQLA